MAQMDVLPRGRIRGQGCVQSAGMGVKIRMVKGVVGVAVEGDPKGGDLGGESQTVASIGFLVSAEAGVGHRQERQARVMPSFLERPDPVLGIIDLRLASDWPMTPR